MRITFLSFVLGFTLLSAQAQTEKPSKAYRNFPLVATVQFHALALPFHDLKTNFSNVGIGLGTEMSLNKRHTLVQQVSAVWYRNKAVGNGMLFYTQTAWRPVLVANFWGELKLGPGYLLAHRPVESYQQVEGVWKSVGHKGKGMFTVPVGISLGYTKYSKRPYVAPFASYQVLLVTNYNASIPLVPQSLFQLGTRIHL